MSIIDEFLYKNCERNTYHLQLTFHYTASELIYFYHHKGYSLEINNNENFEKEVP